MVGVLRPIYTESQLGILTVRTCRTCVSHDLGKVHFRAIEKCSSGLSKQPIGRLMSDVEQLSAAPKRRRSKGPKVGRPKSVLSIANQTVGFGGWAAREDTRYRNWIVSMIPISLISKYKLRRVGSGASHCIRRLLFREATKNLLHYE
jgi:hypothetical protein